MGDATLRIDRALARAEESTGQLKAMLQDSAETCRCCAELLPEKRAHPFPACETCPLGQVAPAAEPPPVEEYPAPPPVLVRRPA